MQSITNHINNKFKKYSGNATQYYLPITKQWYTCRRFKKILQQYNLTLQEYYDKYLLLDINESYCMCCKHKATFVSIGQGYRLTCSNSSCKQYAKQHATKQNWRNADFRQKTTAAIKLSLNKDDVKKKRSLALHLAHYTGKFDTVHCQRKCITRYAGWYKVNIAYCLSNVKIIDNEHYIWCNSYDEFVTIQYIEQLQLQYYKELTKILYFDSNNVRHSYSVDFSIVINDKLLLLECKCKRFANAEINQLKQLYAMQFINDHSTKYLNYVIFYDAKWYTLNDFEVLIHNYL